MAKKAKKNIKREVTNLHKNVGFCKYWYVYRNL